MIEKMEFLSIIGPRDQLDRVTEKYLGKYEIQLENTVGELKNLKNIVPSSESNPYREWIGRAQEAAAIVEGRSGAGASEKKAASPGKAGAKRAAAGREAAQALSPEEAVEAVSWADRLMEETKREKTRLQTELKKKQGLLEAVRPYLELHFELSRILHFKYVRFRFGRLPVGYYQKLKEYLQDYASPDTRRKGEAMIARMLEDIPGDKVRENARKYIDEIAHGARDFRF